MFITHLEACSGGWEGAEGGCHRQKRRGNAGAAQVFVAACSQTVKGKGLPPYKRKGSKVLQQGKVNDRLMREWVVPETPTPH